MTTTTAHHALISMDCIRDVLDCDCELGRTLFTKAVIDLCIITNYEDVNYRHLINVANMRRTNYSLMKNDKFAGACIALWQELPLSHAPVGKC